MRTFIAANLANKLPSKQPFFNKLNLIMGTEQSTANHSYSHNNISPDNYSRPYSFSPNTYHSAVSSSDLKHAYSYGNGPSNIRSGMSRTFL